MFKKTFYILIFLFLIYWIPQLIIIGIAKSNIKTEIDSLPDSDAIMIFGAHITEDNKPTPLLKERLDAGKMIWDKNRNIKLVVSNTEQASKVMKDYFVALGVPSEHIERDTQAETTPDSCRYEKKQYPENRKLIFISQGYHLPRLMYQCKRIGVIGIGYKAEKVNTIDKSQYSVFTKISVRTKRYFREAGVTWVVLLNIY